MNTSDILDLTEKEALLAGNYICYVAGLFFSLGLLPRAKDFTLNFSGILQRIPDIKESAGIV